MTPRVRILPDHVANQIAAGEVVERPASVVKELVENALDAGAQRVEVRLQNGGKTEIRVADDGHGMVRADALLALDRHATSKIESPDDLNTVSSFGFRGEALPSIAAVSRFRLDTAAEEEIGTRIRVEGGRVRSAEDSARRRGTTVTVRSLFYNVPARAKFLRSAGAETRAASETVLLLALVNPGVEFHLESNGRELLRLGPAGTVRDRLTDIWGAEYAASLLPADASEAGLRIEGLIERPSEARPRGGRRYLFVNGRPFREPGLARIVDDEYRTTVPERVRPSFFLFLTVPPGGVDVNVHPAKAEVRFRDRMSVEAAVRGAVSAALGAVSSSATLGGSGAEGAPVAVPPEPGEGKRPDEAAAGERESASQFALFVRRPGLTRADAVHPLIGEPGEIAVSPPDLWQLHNRYILASTREGLLIIDQHSAHERVLFEEIMGRFESGGGESQRLLFPIVLRFSPAEYAAVEELTGLLRRLGFDIEPFGERTVIARASPHPHPRFDPERCLREMIRELAEGSALVDSARNQHERIAKSMACKGAIKAGERLTSEEMSELFDRLFATDLPSHDVHGRPTIVRLALDELDRRFERA